MMATNLKHQDLDLSPCFPISSLLIAQHMINVIHEEAGNW